jgi:hypothetical protein
MERLLDPNEIRTLNSPVNYQKFDGLITAMKKSGWRGRPVIVIETEDEYIALTGSHRIAAAIEAGLDEIPCYLLPSWKLSKTALRACCGHITNDERFDILNKVDRHAGEIMWQEGRE